jgi:hypothetical protein
MAFIASHWWLWLADLVAGVILLFIVVFGNARQGLKGTVTGKSIFRTLIASIITWVFVVANIILLALSIILNIITYIKNV